MTENNHPILPPKELVEQWRNSKILLRDALVIAAQWGANQELEACCEWLITERYLTFAKALKAARRPKPPSLKEQALEQLRALDQHGALDCNTDAIRRALEALPND